MINQMQAPTTLDTHVSCREIRFEVFRAGFGAGEDGVRNPHQTRLLARTSHVGHLDDVTRTTHVTVVLLDAATDAHASVTSVRHQYHVIVVTCHVEGFRFAEVLRASSPLELKD